jgi:gliding motility-associated-like protein
VRIQQIIPVIIILIYFCYPCHAQGQTELPDKPLIRFVSVDTVSGETVIEWEASQSPSVRSYKIYTLDIATFPVTGLYLDSVSAETLKYCYRSAHHKPQIYTVTAVDQLGNESLLSGNYHKSVHLDIQYDSCSRTMLLEWNKYIGWKNNLTGYRIYAKGETGSFEQLVRLDTNTLSFVHPDVEENRYYQYTIEAYDSQGQISTSNVRKYFTYMPPPPEFINLNYVSVLDERTVEISFSADLTGEINDFLVSRASSSEGNYIPIQTLIDVTEPTVQITDNIVTRGEQYYYKVEALNSCFQPISASNPGNNIFVRGTAEGTEIKLEWNPYQEFSTGLANYTVYRKNQYGEYEVVQTVPPGSVSFIEDIRVSGTSEISGQVSYIIEAHEFGTNPLGISGTSRSNEVVVNVETRIWLPNAFTPDGDGLNDIFIPVMDFIPKEYKMYIFDRTGKVLFHSTDPLRGWDGTLNGTGKAREGVYVYHIEYLSYNGVRQVRTGNLTLVYP